MNYVKMDKGSSVCQRLCKKIFENIVYQRKNGRDLHFSSSLVHNIIKRLTEPGGILAHREQKCTSNLDFDT